MSHLTNKIEKTSLEGCMPYLSGQSTQYLVYASPTQPFHSCSLSDPVSGRKYLKMLICNTGVLALHCVCVDSCTLLKYCQGEGGGTNQSRGNSSVTPNKVHHHHHHPKGAVVVEVVGGGMISVAHSANATELALVQHTRKLF